MLMIQNTIILLLSVRNKKQAGILKKKRNQSFVKESMIEKFSIRYRHEQLLPESVITKRMLNKSDPTIYASKM
jgi:hypothetical protein